MYRRPDARASRVAFHQKWASTLARERPAVAHRPRPMSANAVNTLGRRTSRARGSSLMRLVYGRPPANRGADPGPRDASVPPPVPSIHYCPDRLNPLPPCSLTFLLAASRARICAGVSARLSVILAPSLVTFTLNSGRSRVSSTLANAPPNRSPLKCGDIPIRCGHSTVITYSPSGAPSPELYVAIVNAPPSVVSPFGWIGYRSSSGNCGWSHTRTPGSAGAPLIVSIPDTGCVLRKSSPAQPATSSTAAAGTRRERIMAAPDRWNVGTGPLKHKAPVLFCRTSRVLYQSRARSEALGAE